MNYSTTVGRCTLNDTPNRASSIIEPYLHLGSKTIPFEARPRSYSATWCKAICDFMLSRARIRYSIRRSKLEDLGLQSMIKGGVLCEEEKQVTLRAKFDCLGVYFSSNLIKEYIHWYRVIKSRNGMEAGGIYKMLEYFNLIIPRRSTKSRIFGKGVSGVRSRYLVYNYEWSIAAKCKPLSGGLNSSYIDISVLNRMSLWATRSCLLYWSKYLYKIRFW